MTEIRYRQEKFNPIIFIVPAAFIAGGAVFAWAEMAKDAEGAFLFTSLLIPLLCLLVGAGIFFAAFRHAKKDRQEIKELREKGRQLYGEILDIEEHITYSSDGDNGTNKDYSYNFIVRYADPDTAEPVTKESITTYRKYELKDPQCRILVYNGKVLVEKAYVEAKKNLTFIPVLLFFGVALVVSVGKWKGWF